MMVLKVLIFVCVCLFVPVYANDPSESLLYCNNGDIRNINLATQAETVVVSGLRNAYAIDYHYEKNIIFWCDPTEGKIYRTSLSQNRNSKTAIVESNVVSYGIAVDWIHDLVYWTNDRQKSVEVAKLDGSERRTLVETGGGSEPWGIVLNPLEDIIFWEDRTNHYIERCQLDGTNRIVIVTEGLSDPSGFAIDLDGRRIFWVDHTTKTLYTAKFDGTQRRIVYTHRTYIQYYFLDVGHKYIYWAAENAVYRMLKENGGDLTRLSYSNIHIYNARGLRVFSPLKQPTDMQKTLVTKVTAEKRQCVQFFLETRSNSSVNKWGQQLPRTAVALYLTDKDFFAPENKTGQEIRYELAIHLLSTLNRHEILRTERLTMYVHALLASCLNPHNFFRHDLVSELRKRVDNSKYVNPFAILALCNAGAAMTHQDVQRLNETYHSQHVNYWIEVQVICTMALSCLSSRTNVSVDQEVLRQWIDSAKDYPLTDEAATNPRTVALIAQLMLSTNYTRDFNWTAAVRAITNPTFVKSSIFLDKYYLTPVLSNKSLNAIDNKHCSPYFENDLLYSSNPDSLYSSNPDSLYTSNPNSSIIRYTVRVENDDLAKDKSWRIKMPPLSTLYDVMMTLQTLDTDHTVKFNIVNGKPYVGTVSGLAEDPEYDIYWFTYVRTEESAPDLRLLEKSPEDVVVTEEDEYIIWYRNAIWKTTSYGSGEHH